MLNLFLKHAASSGQASPAAPSSDARDAARYRWLRGKRVDFDLMGLHSYHATKLWNQLGERLNWDDAIDAAIAAQEKAKAVDSKED